MADVKEKIALLLNLASNNPSENEFAGRAAQGPRTHGETQTPPGGVPENR